TNLLTLQVEYLPGRTNDVAGVEPVSPPPTQYRRIPPRRFAHGAARATRDPHDHTANEDRVAGLIPGHIYTTGLVEGEFPDVGFQCAYIKNQKTGSEVEISRRRRVVSEERDRKKIAVWRESQSASLIRRCCRMRRRPPKKVVGPNVPDLLT